MILYAIALTAALLGLPLNNQFFWPIVTVVGDRTFSVLTLLEIFVDIGHFCSADTRRARWDFDSTGRSYIPTRMNWWCFKKVHFVAGNSLVACFEDKANEAICFRCYPRERRLRRNAPLIYEIFSN
jgi:hypothetical protein